MEITAKDVMTLRKKTGAGMMNCKKALKETDGDMDAAIKYLREKGMAAAKKRADRAASEGRVAVHVSPDKRAASMVLLQSETDFVARNSEFIELADYLVKQAFELGPEKAVEGLLPPDAIDTEKVKLLAGKIGENLQLGAAAYLAVEGDGLIESYIHPGDQLGVLVEVHGDAETLKSPAAIELAHDLALQIAAAAPLFVHRDQVPTEAVEKEKDIYRQQMLNEGKPEAIIEKIIDGKLNKYYEEVCLLDQVYVKEQKTRVNARVKEASKAAGGELGVTRFIRFKVGEGPQE